MHTTHSTMHTIHSTLHTIHNTPHTIHSTLQWLYTVNSPGYARGRNASNSIYTALQYYTDYCRFMSRTVQFSTALYSLIQFSTVKYSIVQGSTLQYWACTTVPDVALQWCGEVPPTEMHQSLSCSLSLHYTVLHYTTVHYSTLQYTSPDSNAIQY